MVHACIASDARQVHTDEPFAAQLLVMPVCSNVLLDDDCRACIAGGERDAAADSHCWMAVTALKLYGMPAAAASPPSHAGPAADLGVARFVGADLRSAAGFCPTHAGARGFVAGLLGPWHFAVTACTGSATETQH
jgi:hypothetical protein